MTFIAFKLVYYINIKKTEYIDNTRQITAMLTKKEQNVDQLCCLATFKIITLTVSDCICQ